MSHDSVKQLYPSGLRDNIAICCGRWNARKALCMFATCAIDM
jgi:hypothetical protein